MHLIFLKGVDQWQIAGPQITVNLTIHLLRVNWFFFSEASNPHMYSLESRIDHNIPGRRKD